MLQAQIGNCMGIPLGIGSHTHTHTPTVGTGFWDRYLIMDPGYDLWRVYLQVSMNYTYEMTKAVVSLMYY
jgi:hypothetical protein